jgi:hypothetical protein
MYKSVHIKECWPFEYKVEDKIPKFGTRIQRTKAQKASANNLANWRIAERRKKTAQVKTPKGQKLLKLPVYELDIDFCNRLNNESQSSF